MHELVVALIVLAGVPPAVAGSVTVTIPASHDATLIEDPDGGLANGAGPYAFVGRSGQGVRRMAVRFDVAAALPRHALIEAVSLTLYLAPSNPGAHRLRLHRVLADWSEGRSVSLGGGGATSQFGDTTWLHRFYDEQRWVRPGGDFVGRPSAELLVGDAEFYTWNNTVHLIQDVRLWLAAPARNFGWIVIGEELIPQSAKKFAARESPDPMQRPLLQVTYRLPGR